MWLSGTGTPFEFLRSAILILLPLQLCNAQPAQLYMESLFFYGKYLDSAFTTILKLQVNHIPWFEGSERREPWYFSTFSWSNIYSASLIRDIAPLDSFPSYFLHCDPGPVAFVESNTHSLSHGSLP